jgi:hypothetical protein
VPSRTTQTPANAAARATNTRTTTPDFLVIPP